VKLIGYTIATKDTDWRFVEPNVRAKEALINQVDCDDLPE